MSTNLTIPSSWLHTPKVETRTELILQRRKNSIPHSSFDLDGDGAVGAHDLVLASKFDLDKDGKLNPEERENALKALSQGYSNQFLWGCESSGLNRSFRLVQKRGKVIADEDFSKIRETYPALPADDRQLTRTKLEETRKSEAKVEGKKNEQRINTVTKLMLPIESFLCKEHYVSEPKYSSISEKRDIERQKARVKAGLLMEPKDIRSAEVKFSYSQNPANLSYSEMRATRRDDLVSKLNSSADYDHITFYEKVEKEKQYIGNGSKQLKDILDERRKRDVGHFEKTFSQRARGIHGKELPKFEDNVDGSMRSTDIMTRQEYSNPFENYTKEYHKIEQKTEEITGKPTQTLHVLSETDPKNNLNSKWSTFHWNFMPHSTRSQETYQERLKLIKASGGEKKQFRFLSTAEITPPITQRLLQKNGSPTSRFKSITSTGFANR